MEAILGSLLGGLFRMAPEFLKWLDRKDERKHEAMMLDKQNEADRLRSAAQLEATKVEGAFVLAGKDIDALIAGAKAQGQMTGVKWVDAINSLMRPVITFWWVIVLQTAVMICSFIILTQSGSPTVEAIVKLWGPEEKAIVGSIISFWFLDRVLRRGAQ